jgi:arginyl-tRNA synthetase
VCFYNDPTPSPPPSSQSQLLYKASKKRFDADPDFKARAREAVTRLQGGEPAVVAAWERICAASRAEFEQIYDRLGVAITERGESFYNPALPGVVEDLKAAGVAVESDGATVVWTEGLTAPLIVQKSDGGFGYATTDLAALRQRVSDEGADWVIYVTDAGQATHFRQVFDAARRAAIIPADPAATPLPRIDHVGFGLVLGADGKRIRTRDEGAAVRLVELLDEAVSRCAASLREREPDADPAFIDAAAKAMGYGAVKYADLKNNRTTNYK